MNSKKQRVGLINRTVAIIAAVLIHIVVIFFLWTNFSEQREQVAASDAVEIDTITATTISANEINNQKKKIENAEKDKKRKESERRKREQEKLEKLKKDQEKLKQDQKKEQEKLKKLKEEQEREEKAIALKRKKEKERKEKEKKQKQEQERKKKEEKRKAEQRKKKREEAEAEAERLKAIEEAKRKALSDELESELNAEQKNISAQQANRNTASLQSKYASLIIKKLESNFAAPLGSQAGMKAIVNIKLDQIGRVKSSKIIQSSGNFAYDRAVLVAVGKSEPLPLPTIETDRKAHQALRDINLTVDF
ncbi:MAG: cell envelope integrity protein TolA [Arenicella sp.]